jgi:hypothetical protein
VKQRGKGGMAGGGRIRTRRRSGLIFAHRGFQMLHGIVVLEAL